ncbi:MAG: 2-oxoacid:acceptor oxidoreductase family protein [Acidobacteriota bacterium]|jgi:2-oxoisovalerate ferredoxin oxidoreductase beta subunit
MSDPLFDRPHSFYGRFDRKGGDQGTTHYCPGCGHGNVHKMIAEAIDDLGIQDRTILMSPVGCSVFAYYYMDVGNIQAAHGRAPAAATGAKRAHPDSIAVVYQGDGDLAAIGTAEILHAANRGENLTVFFINNAIYGMTGGQMAPTTLAGQRTATTPAGRDVHNDGYPIRVCELLSQLEAPVYLERVALGDNRHNRKVRQAVRRALENQVKGMGFSLVEILSPCPTGWKMTPVEACAWTLEEMVKKFPLGVYRDRTDEPPGGPRPRRQVPREQVPEILGIQQGPPPRPSESLGDVDLRAKASGFGGQGALTTGLVLAETGRLAGLQVSWLPSYGPEMRGGTAHCHVCISRQPVGSPLITRPNVLFAMNLPSLERFVPEVTPGGIVIYNTSMIDRPPSRDDIQALGIPVTEIADRLGNPRGANMVMLGAYLELSGALPMETAVKALETFFQDGVLAKNREALAAGAEHARRAPKEPAPVSG